MPDIKFSREVYVYVEPGSIHPWVPDNLAFSTDMAYVAKRSAIAGKSIRVGVYILEKFVDVSSEVVISEVPENGG